MNAKNYKKTVSWLYEQLPMFHRIGAAAYKANLNNTRSICKLLGNPETKFKSIHIAGTNGKGSCSHMLAAVFQQAGYKTGLYTSPHLVDFRERVRINGQYIPKKNIARFVQKHRAKFEKMKPSFFEWTVGLAFDHFAKEKVDIAIIEVGLGGRLDSTNVIKPILSLITNIGLDHSNLLGNTLRKIAREKAGIIKRGVPVVISETQKETEHLFREKARYTGSKIYFADQLFFHTREEYFPLKGTSVHSFQENNTPIHITSDLPGTYQRYNIAGVLCALDVLKKKYPVKPKYIRSALKKTKKLTGLHGRWELLSKNPRIIADTGHNAEGIKQVTASVMREFDSGAAQGKLHVVFGAVNDKDLSSIFAILHNDFHFSMAQYYFCKPSIPRGLPVHELKHKASLFELYGKTYSSVQKALHAAKKQAKPKELIFVGGSTFTVADALD